MSKIDIRDAINIAVELAESCVQDYGTENPYTSIRSDIDITLREHGEAPLSAAEHEAIKNTLFPTGYDIHIQDYEQELADLKDERDDLQAEIDDLQDTVHDLETELDELKGE